MNNYKIIICLRGSFHCTCFYEGVVFKGLTAHSPSPSRRNIWDSQWIDVHFAITWQANFAFLQQTKTNSIHVLLPPTFHEFLNFIWHLRTDNKIAWKRNVRQILPFYSSQNQNMFCCSSATPNVARVFNIATWYVGTVGDRWTGRAAWLTNLSRDNPAREWVEIVS